MEEGEGNQTGMASSLARVMIRRQAAQHALELLALSCREFEALWSEEPIGWTVFADRLPSQSP